MTTYDPQALLEVARAAAWAASEAILEVYADAFDVRRKNDASPVTLADEQAERVILARLRAATPEIPVIAEEDCERNGVPRAAPGLFWLVDPLDGTKEFINRNGEFTVNIALVDGTTPVLGVVQLPVLGLAYAGAGPGTASRQRKGDAPVPIAARLAPAAGCIVVGSRSHGDDHLLEAFLADRKVAERQVSGSSLKFCRVAEGTADLYPRFGPTMEWDTAAGQAVLEAAGGSVVTIDGQSFTYGKPGFLNPGFIARGRA